MLRKTAPGPQANNKAAHTSGSFAFFSVQGSRVLGFRDFRVFRVFRV